MIKKILFGLLISTLCTTYVQSEPRMFRDDKGRWLNSEGGNIYNDFRFNPNADYMRFNIDADPRYNINADPRFNIDANPRFNREANPNFSIDGDGRYQ